MKNVVSVNVKITIFGSFGTKYGIFSPLAALAACVVSVDSVETLTLRGGVNVRVLYALLL